MQAINVSNGTVEIQRAVKTVIPNPDPEKPDIEISAYRKVVFEPGQIRDMDGYAKPRKPMSTVEMLSQGKVLPISHPRARAYLAKHGKPIPDAADRFAVTEATIAASEFHAKLDAMAAKLSELETQKAQDEQRIQDLEEALTGQDSAQETDADEDSEPSALAPEPTPAPTPAPESKSKASPSNGGRKRSHGRR